MGCAVFNLLGRVCKRGRVCDSRVYTFLPSALCSREYMSCIQLTLILILGDNRNGSALLPLVHCADIHYPEISKLLLPTYSHCTCFAMNMIDFLSFLVYLPANHAKSKRDSPCIDITEYKVHSYEINIAKKYGLNIIMTSWMFSYFEYSALNRFMKEKRLTSHGKHWLADCLSYFRTHH